MNILESGQNFANIKSCQPGSLALERTVLLAESRQQANSEAAYAELEITYDRTDR
jgi:hypothetical protein